jgi:uncharacterized membrane protein (UPF0127 family)
MKILNKNKGSILAEAIILADTPWKRIKGLLGRRASSFRGGQAIVLKPCKSIHTFFMAFSIDILFMDQQGRIVKTISSLRPFRLTPLFLNSYFVIELPAGTIQATRTEEGDYLKLE